MAKKIGLFVDVSNIYYCVNKKFENGRLDYEKFLEYIKTFGDIYRAIAYGSQIENEAIDFITCLKKIGYDTKYKRPRERQYKEPVRVNWNVGIAMDVARIVENLDMVVLASSNPDLAPLIEWVKEKGVRVMVVACGISRDLKEVTDQYIEISEDYIAE